MLLNLFSHKSKTKKVRQDKDVSMSRVYFRNDRGYKDCPATKIRSDSFVVCYFNNIWGKKYLKIDDKGRIIDDYQIRNSDGIPESGFGYTDIESAKPLNFKLKDNNV